MANNPLRYVDPTGHTAVSDDGFCIGKDCEGGGVNGSDSDISLTPGGDDVYNLYIDYRDTPGWWNNGILGVLTLADFVGMWILFELNIGDAVGTIAMAGVLATVIAQNLYVGGNNPAVCARGGTCFNAVFNTMAALSLQTGGLFSGPDNSSVKNHAKDSPGLTRVSGKDFLTLIRDLGSAALSPGSVVTWDRDNGPSIWGNIKGGKDLEKKHGIDPSKVNGWAKTTVYYYYPSSAIFLSVNQYNNLVYLKVDMTLCTPGVDC